MKKALLVFLAGFFLMTGFAQEYTPVDNGSKVKFSIKNFGVATGGSFTGLQGTIKFDPANAASAHFDVSIDANTVDTDNSSRDGHLRKEDYFDVKKHPRIHFKSVKVHSSSPGNYTMEGDITIKGKTKRISFPFKATAQNNGYLFEGSFKLNRRDFKVGGSSLVLSDNLTVTLSVTAAKK